MTQQSCTKILVDRDLLEYAAEVLLGSGCPEEDYEPDCVSCQMRLKGEELRELIGGFSYDPE